MKFSVVALSCLAHLPLHSRPEAEGNSTILEEPFEEDEDCDVKQVYKDRHTRCIGPGTYIRNQLACFNCGGVWPFRYDKHPWCKVPCCDGRGPIDTKPGKEKCGCVHAGQSYEVGLRRNDNSKCCATDIYEHSVGTKGKCGCSAVGSKPKYGGVASDCCSGTMKLGKCVKRPCAKKGEPDAGLCCTNHDGTYEKKNIGVCACFHAGEKPNENDDVAGDNCCSGGLNAQGVCGCIKADDSPLPPGADERDCCSKKIIQKGNLYYCADPKCTDIGGDASGGSAHCCSGHADKDKKCACVPPGTAVTDGGQCCSGWSYRGRCEWLMAGEKVPVGVHGASNETCWSKETDVNGVCACVRAGKESKGQAGEGQCCSGQHRQNSAICGCVPTQYTLSRGAIESDCCSGQELDGQCKCANPGAPIPAIYGKHECCTKDLTGEHQHNGMTHAHCSCYPVGTEVQEDQAGLCCGRAWKHGKCACIRSGFLIAPFVPAKSCCSREIGEYKDGHICK